MISAGTFDKIVIIIYMYVFIGSGIFKWIMNESIENLKYQNISMA